MAKYNVYIRSKPGTGGFSKNVIVEGVTPTDARLTAEGMYPNYTIGTMSVISDHQPLPNRTPQRSNTREETPNVSHSNSDNSGELALLILTGIVYGIVFIIKLIYKLLTDPKVRRWLVNMRKKVISWFSK